MKKMIAKERREQENKRKKQEEIQKIESADKDAACIKKSRAKAAGLKSTFILSDDKLLMTSFGKGAVACPEKYIENTGNRISDASANPSLNVTLKKNQFHISGRTKEDAVADNPLRMYEKSNVVEEKKADTKSIKKSEKKPGDDLIHCRKNLEKIYFGRTFEDNIHIQLIYSILDIEKILAVHVNNIVFELDNLLRREGDEHDDLIGYMGLTREKYDKFRESKIYPLFEELLTKRRLGYFGTEFVLPRDKTGQIDQDKRDEYQKKMYYLLSILGQVRQATAHGDIATRASLYKLEQSCKLNMVEAKNYLDQLYSKRIRRLNKDFLKRAAKDLYILSEIYDVKTDQEKKELAERYYSFVVRKDYKNLGFSVRKLREVLLEKYEQNLKNVRYDSVRARLYRMIDFVITSYYMEEKNISHVQRLVDELRGARKESEKLAIYYCEAEKLHSSIKHLLKEHITKINGAYIAKIGEYAYEKTLIEDVIVPEKGHFFCEMIYFLTMFLDGKEINDLLTQLINKFDNINSFLEIMKEEELYVEFETDYQMFKDSDEIARELRVINSIARMSEPEPSAKKIMFMEAAELLGYEKDEKELSKYIDAMLAKDGTERVFYGIRDNGFRNFIINNVIESNRFKYLVRYGNPKKIKALANNEAVVKFVLKDIPDEQIRLYYNSCNGCKKNYYPEMRDDLADKILNLHFSDYADIAAGNKEQEKKERSKNIVRIYLTVLYLLLKNMVYINSRYFLAFHCLERDYVVYNYGKKSDPEEFTKDYTMFAKEFLEEHPLYYRAQDYVKKNMMQSEPWAIKAYRNCCDHLTAIRNIDSYIGDIKEIDSYFGLYHYLVQRSLKNQYEYDVNTESKYHPGSMIADEEMMNPALLEYFKKVDTYHSYCKDFVKALNVAFAYNLPRYKNLSIKELYDRNDYNPTKGKKIEMEG